MQHIFCKFPFIKYVDTLSSEIDMRKMVMDSTKSSLSLLLVKITSVCLAVVQGEHCFTEKMIKFEISGLRLISDLIPFEFKTNFKLSKTMP